jgi:transcriptional regulator with XRE-family HTH domain
MIEFFDTILESKYIKKGKTVTIGERIKILRLKKGLSQRALARQAHVRHATLVELETGIRTETRTDIARRLAKVLGVTVDYLVGMYENEEEGEASVLTSVG